MLTGNGASRGAGQGKVRFLRSALELNRVGKGEILAAERTDPDMVPGMRVASAILADVGGDTSHAAITSRELGIAAVIGIQNPRPFRLWTVWTYRRRHPWARVPRPAPAA